MKSLQYTKTRYQSSYQGTTNAHSPHADILVIYTGGTLGMVKDPQSHALVPFNFEQIIDRIPEIGFYNISITVISFAELIDSSNIHPSHWLALATLVHENYHDYNGFVILHGTDTMAYSASALSFMLKGLKKPVVFTGSQLPIGVTRTDARENIITALEIAAARKPDGTARVPEVCIFFGSKLYRGNRAKKIASAHFAAFDSPNYPPLAEAGTQIIYNDAYVLKPDYKVPFNPQTQLDSRVSVFKIYPSLSPEIFNAVLDVPRLKGLVLETYGSGNCPTQSWFYDTLEKAVAKGVLIYNISQCEGGIVLQGRYETSRRLNEIGVIGGYDLTTEAALCKLMFLLGQKDNYTRRQIVSLLQKPIVGELTKQK